MVREQYGERAVWRESSMGREQYGERAVWRESSMGREQYGERAVWRELSSIREKGMRDICESISTHYSILYASLHTCEMTSTCGEKKSAMVLMVMPPLACE
jgi:hypothetical protein